MLTRIQEGQFPTLRYKSRNASDDIDVLLSTVHLTDAMPAFQQCLQNLHPYLYNDIRKLTVHFELEKAELNAEAQAALIKIADYVKIDPSVKSISIAGYTDNHGRKRLNIPLSEARAAAVKNFLMAQEIPEKLITITFHREFNPSTTNKTKKGRAFNRRAEIEVLR